MSPARDALLAAAYRATAYRVELPDGVCELRVDSCHPRLDAWLQALDADVWAYLTAMNPGSRRFGAAANRQRQRALAQRLDRSGRRWVPGLAVADAGDWPAEAGSLVAGLGAAEASALARAFGQNALLVGVAGAPAQLLWVGRVAAASATRSDTTDACVRPGRRGDRRREP